MQSKFLFASIDMFIEQYKPNGEKCEQQFEYVSLSIVLQFLSLYLSHFRSAISS